jgi:hypothetical protein
MYCKECGHRSDESTEDCEQCGARLKTEGTFERARKKVRWHVPITAVVIGLVAFGILPRLLFRPELETVGPTDKLRFLRALEHSDYRRVGQHGLRVEQQTLVVIWDLRWNALPETKQREIVRIVGHAWNVVGGQDTRFQIEGEDGSMARYDGGNVRLSSDSDFSSENRVTRSLP